jgi:hypothetical protein
MWFRLPVQRITLMRMESGKPLRGIGRMGDAKAVLNFEL